MSKQVAIEQDGKVIETLPNAMFLGENSQGTGTSFVRTDCLSYPCTSFQPQLKGCLLCEGFDSLPRLYGSTVL